MPGSWKGHDNELLANYSAPQELLLGGDLQEAYIVINFTSGRSGQREEYSRTLRQWQPVWLAGQWPGRSQRRIFEDRDKTVWGRSTWMVL